MGFGIKELLVVLVIVLLLFGTKKLKSIGSDLGGAIKGFKKSVSDEDAEKQTAEKLEEKDVTPSGTTIDAKADKVENSKSNN